MQTFYAILANVVAGIHVAYVLFVLFGLLYILVGWLFRWPSARNFWFRITHLVMIGIVVAETVFGIQCPLTVWEDQLLAKAGIARAAVVSRPGEVEMFHERDFIGRKLHGLIHFELPFNHPIFTIGYISFGVLVLMSFIGYPPRWPEKKTKADDALPSASPLPPLAKGGEGG